MAVRMSRKTRRLLTQSKQRTSRMLNGELKRKERGRRDARMRDLVRKGKHPYTPAVLSWLSAQLGKPGSQITQADVDGLLKKK
jgi:hypothetical protein